MIFWCFLIAQAITKNKTLTMLNLRSNGLGSIGKEKLLLSILDV